MNAPSTFDAFLQIDIRVGTITEASDFPEARKPAYQLVIDFGPHGMLKSSAQLVDDYKKSDLIGRKIIAVVNLPPRQIANFMSECLVLGAVNNSGSVRLLQADHGAENGDRVS
jgi:tRNA-binding protein